MGSCDSRTASDAEALTNTELKALICDDDGQLILKHATIEKKSRYLGEWHTRWAVLTPDTLYTFKTQHNTAIYQNENGNTYLRMTQELQSELTESIDLNTYDILEDFSWRYSLFQKSTMSIDWPSFDLHFQLQTQNANDHVFQFQCVSHTEKDEWCSSITQALGLPDSKLITKLKNEMKQNVVTPISSHDKMLSLIQGYCNSSIDNNIPMSVIQMIFDHLFQNIECCFLSRKVKLSTLDFLERGCVPSARWFDSNWSLDPTEIPFEITTLSQNEGTFVDQVLQSRDCTSHNNFQPFDLEYMCSFPRIQLTESIQHQIILSKNIKLDLDDCRTKSYLEELSETRFDLLVTKRRASDLRKGGYWMHFVDYKALFGKCELLHNAYGLPINVSNMREGCSFTFNAKKSALLMVSEMVSDIVEYDLNTFEWVNVGVHRVWAKKKRNAASLCWLNESKLMIIGGHNIENGTCSTIKSAVDLYDVKTNVMIPLEPMCEDRSNAGSLYVQHLNKIVVGSDKTMEVYDPTKDHWRLYQHETKKRYCGTCFMWNDVMNPNLLYLANHKLRKCHIEWIDLRTNSKWKILETPQNVSYFGQFYLNPNAV
eukprot:636007_1